MRNELILMETLKWPTIEHEENDIATQPIAVLEFPQQPDSSEPRNEVGTTEYAIA